MSQRRQIEEHLNKLPESFTADEILRMYEALEQDVAFCKKNGIPQAAAETQLHQKHKTLAYSYPTIFFKALRGEMDKHIFNSLLNIKRQVEDGEVTDKRAKELVIDGAKRHVEGEAPRRPHPNSNQEQDPSRVQEINVRCQVEEDR